MNTLRQDKDRLRLLKQCLEETEITAAQAVLFMKEMVYGDGQVESCVLAYPSLSDKANFEPVLLAALKYPEDRVNVKQKLAM